MNLGRIRHGKVFRQNYHLGHDGDAVEHPLLIATFMLWNTSAMKVNSSRSSRKKHRLKNHFGGGGFLDAH